MASEPRRSVDALCSRPVPFAAARVGPRSEPKRLHPDDDVGRVDCRSRLGADALGLEAASTPVGVIPRAAANRPQAGDCSGRIGSATRASLCADLIFAEFWTGDWGITACRWFAGSLPIPLVAWCVGYSR